MGVATAFYICYNRKNVYGVKTLESLEQIKINFAKNLAALRKQSGMTQLELAEKLQYSDKAISKWERGESVPDISVLKHVSATFGVGIDYLIEAEHTAVVEESKEIKRAKHKNRAIITAISVAAVWLVALTAYVTASMATDGRIHLWLAFIYAIPVSAIVWLVLNSVWFNRRRNFFIVSLLLWAVLTALYLSIRDYSGKAWQLFLLGIPGQIITFFWSKIKTRTRKTK